MYSMNNSNALFMLYATTNTHPLFIKGAPNDDETTFLESFKVFTRKNLRFFNNRSCKLIGIVDQRFVQDCLLCIGAFKSLTGQKGRETLKVHGSKLIHVIAH